MASARQFSLTYLLREIFWIAAALGCFSELSYARKEWQSALLVYGTLFAGIAFGVYSRVASGYWLRPAGLSQDFMSLMTWQHL
jgi:hypothetical protein